MPVSHRVHCSVLAFYVVGGSVLRRRMEEMKKGRRTHNLHPFKGSQMEEVEITGDNILSVSGQGAGQHCKIVWVTQQC